MQTRSFLAKIYGLVILFGTWGLAAEAFAYSYETYNGCWTDIGDPYNPFDNKDYCCYRTAPARFSGNQIRFYRSGVSFPDGNAFTDALITAWSRWNNGASNIQFSTVRDDSGFVGIDNGYNEIWISSDEGFMNGYPAFAQNQYNWKTCYYDESDMVFDATPDGNLWSTTESETNKYMFSATQTARSFISTALHELGHTAGLQHESRYYNIMGSDTQYGARNGTTLYYGPGEDGNHGMAAIYGTGTGKEDISASSLKYLGVSGEYSTHQFTVIYTSAGVQVGANAARIAGQPSFNVVRGSTYRFEFTGENNGTTSSINTNWAIYLSTNNVISTTDQLLSSGTWTLTRNTPSTATFNATIPSGLARGTYYIGVFLDSNNTLAEKSEANNFAFIPVIIP